MANYLYFVGGANALPSATKTGVYDFSYFDVETGTIVKPSTTLVINNAGGLHDGLPCGDAYASGGRGVSWNHSDNWTKWMNSTAPQPPIAKLTIGCVDADVATSLDFAGEFQGFTDRTFNTQDQTMHHGSLSTGVMTVLVPGSVTKFGSQLDATVLVWYIAGGSLGAGANAIGLPMRPQDYPTSAMTDSDAAARILWYGMGVFQEKTGKHDAMKFAPVG